MALSARDGRINADMAGHISALGAAIRQPRPSNDMFEAVTAEKSLSLAQVLESGRLSFALS